MARTRHSIKGQFHARTIEMLESHAYRELSLSAHMVLNRISIELAHHAGNDNGHLPVTYDNFVAYGVHRHAIGPALRELVALGFIEVTARGRASAGEFRTPNLFRITFQPILNRNKAIKDPTDEWKKIETPEDAQFIAKAARKASERPTTIPRNRSKPPLRAVQ